MARLISTLEAAQRLGTSNSGLYRLRALPEFPKPIRLTGPRGKPVWDVDEIDAFIAHMRRQAV